MLDDPVTAIVDAASAMTSRDGICDVQMRLVRFLLSAGETARARDMADAIDDADELGTRSRAFARAQVASALFAGGDQAGAMALVDRAVDDLIVAAGDDADDVSDIGVVGFILFLEGPGETALALAAAGRAGPWRSGALSEIGETAALAGDRETLDTVLEGLAFDEAAARGPAWTALALAVGGEREAAWEAAGDLPVAADRALAWAYVAQAEAQADDEEKAGAALAHMFRDLDALDDAWQVLDALTIGIGIIAQTGEIEAASRVIEKIDSPVVADWLRRDMVEVLVANGDIADATSWARRIDGEVTRDHAWERMACILCDAGRLEEAREVAATIGHDNFRCRAFHHLAACSAAGRQAENAAGDAAEDMARAVAVAVELPHAQRIDLAPKLARGMVDYLAPSALDDARKSLASIVGGKSEDRIAALLWLAWLDLCQSDPSAGIDSAA